MVFGTSPLTIAGYSRVLEFTELVPELQLSTREQSN